MARCLAPELEKLADSQQFPVWLHRRNMDEIALESPWKSPKCRTGIEDKQDRDLPELSRNLSGFSITRRRTRTTAPALTLAQITSSTYSPGQPLPPSPSPSLRPSLRPSRSATSRASVTVETFCKVTKESKPSGERVRNHTTPPRYTSTFLASPFLPAPREVETCAAPRRKRPVSYYPRDIKDRPALAPRGLSAPSNSFSRPMSLVITERAEDEDRGLMFESSKMVLDRMLENQSRVERWAADTVGIAQKLSSLEVDIEVESHMSSSLDSMASGCGMVTKVQTRSQGAYPIPRISQEQWEGKQSKSVSRAPDQPILGSIDSKRSISIKTDITMESGEGHSQSPTPSPGHQGTLRELGVLSVQHRRAQRTPLLPLSTNHLSANLQPTDKLATSPLSKHFSLSDMEIDTSADQDVKEKDGFDLDEIDFGQDDSGHPGFAADGYFVDRTPSLIGDQEDSVLTVNPAEDSIASLWTIDRLSGKRPLAKGKTRDQPSPNVAFHEYDSFNRRRGSLTPGLPHSVFLAEQGTSSPNLFSAHERKPKPIPLLLRKDGSSPDSPTRPGCASPTMQSAMLSEASGSSSEEEVEQAPAVRTSLQEGTLMDQLFPKANRALLNRPGIPRRTTAPAAAGRVGGVDFPLIPSTSRKSALITADNTPRTSIDNSITGTPNNAFCEERPSPAAFMSSGLVKKGSFRLGRRERSATNGPPLPSAIIRRPNALFVDTQMKRMPDTPVKPPSGLPAVPLMTSNNLRLQPMRLPSSGSALPIADFIEPSRLASAPSVSREHKMSKFSNRTWERSDTQDSTATAVPFDRASVHRSGGLRRKGSALFARTTSGNWSNGSWSRQTAGGIEEEVPMTPTRTQDNPTGRLEFASVDTPSPKAASGRDYPFESGKVRHVSPSPPKRKNLFQRWQGTKQKALRKISNPLLSTAYRLGESQSQAGSTKQSGTNDNIRAARRPRSSLISSPSGMTRFERDFILLEPVGNGEFSTVWKVKEKSTKTIWAVKRGKPYLGKKDRERQFEEVEILRNLMRHPNPFIIQFQEAWEERQQLHIRTALAECGDLATYLEAIGDTGGLDEGRCWKLLFELSSGLRHIHSLGILHLDLKPANILVTGIGSLQISDFGLSTFENRKSATCRTPTIGSPREGDREYLSPETLDGQFGRATDVFSLGITLLEASFNIVLPSNGEAWQKLRSDDFSDLEDHLVNQQLEPVSCSDTATPSSPSGTSITTESSLSSLEADSGFSGKPSREFLVTIKGMMRSDPAERWSMQDVWEFPVIQRLHALSLGIKTARVSVESAARSSLDDWADLRSSALYASSQSPRIVVPVLELPHKISPALVPQDSSDEFLCELLKCWRPTK